MNEANDTLFAEVPSSDEARKERRAASSREYKRRNKEKIAAYKKEYNERTKEARSESYKIWYEKNKETKLAYAREWKKNNPDKVKEVLDEWIKNNPERRKEHDKRKYQKNKEVISVRTKAYYEANRDVIRERERIRNNTPEAKERRRTYARNNLARRCLLENRRRARKLNAGGEHEIEDISKLLELQRGKCAGVDCKKSIKKGYHIDHIIPLSRGGMNDKYNLQLLCPTCNMRKGARDPITHNQSLGMLL